MAGAWPALVRSFLRVGSAHVPTEVLSIPATSSPVLQVLVIPGNPGNANYYTSFMQLLHSAFRGKAEVVGVSYAGHDNGPDNTGEELYELEDQVSHKVDFMREHLLLPGRPPLVVIGHSIGAYVAVHAVSQLEREQLRQALQQHSSQLHTQQHHHKQHHEHSHPHLHHQHQHQHQAPASSQQAHLHSGSQQQSAEAHKAPGVELHAASGTTTLQRIPPVLKVVALMPFLQTNLALCWRQRMLSLLARQYRLMGWIAWLLSRLPTRLQEAFIAWWTKGSMDPDAVATTRALLHRPSILNNFYLACTEFRDLSRPFAWHLLRQLGQRLHLLACPKDMWLPDHHFQEVLMQVPDIQTHWAHDLTHAFCTSKDQCEKVAFLVAGLHQQDHRILAREAEDEASREAEAEDLRIDIQEPPAALPAKL